MSDPTRRRFLGRTGAAAILPLASPARAAEPNLFDMLSRFRFMGVDGKEVNVAALRQQLQNQHVTLSFGFGDCTQFCPLANPTLAALGDVNRDGLASIAVNVHPELDGYLPDLRASYPQHLRQVGIKQNLIVLYPMDAKGQLADREAPRLATALGAVARQDSPQDHSAKIFLFAPGGALKAQKLSTHPTEEFIDEWTPILAARGQGR